MAAVKKRKITIPSETSAEMFAEVYWEIMRGRVNKLRGSARQNARNRYTSESQRLMIYYYKMIFTTNQIANHFISMAPSLLKRG